MGTVAKTKFLTCFILSAALFSCRSKHDTKAKDVVKDPSEMNARVTDNITALLSAAESKKFLLPDSSRLNFYAVLKNYYGATDAAPIWSNKEKFSATAGALVIYLQNAKYEGLFPEDYHFQKISRIKDLLDHDSLKRSDAVLWANAELLMTDALAGLLKDLKQGRLQPDSLSWGYDTSKYRKYFAVSIDRIKNGEILDSVLEHVQPQHDGYRLLKSGIKKFTDSMDTRRYTYLVYPYKDSVTFLRQFKKRMSEGGMVIPADADSATLSGIVKKYQQKAGITADGKIGNGVVKKLNLTDEQRFNMIAVTLDRYKSLPEKMPEKYIWVNLPAYYLKVWDHDTMVFESKTICGKPATPTPYITSAISDIVIYPTWTVPSSIISKDMLPGLKRNPNYLSRKGLYLLSNSGARIDPASVNWAKYSKGIPYRIQQGSGDDNALGVIKFNFSNPFSVYLHDTNQRYLFKNGVRCLSHGCVRVQEWEKLADYIVRNDSLIAKKTDTMKCNTDSIKNWIAHKERHTIDVKNKLPLFIRYFTCEYVNNAIKFYDDIYGDDRALAQKYFAGK